MIEVKTSNAIPKEDNLSNFMCYVEGEWMFGVESHSGLIGV